MAYEITNKGKQFKSSWDWGHKSGRQGEAGYQLSVMKQNSPLYNM